MKSISLIKVTLAIFVTTLLSVAVSAEEKIAQEKIAIESTTQQIQFTQLDLNKNGLLSETEVATDKVLHDAFAKVDLNGDATISKDEYSTFIKTANK